MTVDNIKLQSFLEKVVIEWGAAEGALMNFIGDKLGLFKAMANGDPVTAESLALKTGTSSRMIAEWLEGQAAGGFVIYDLENDAYSLPEEHAEALTNENNSAYISGFYQSIVSLYKDEDKIIEAFKTGRGLGWGDHHHYLYEGTERFFRPSYLNNLVQNWIPALKNVQNSLIMGAHVADVGCGHGASTILMAKEYPRSHIVGFDYHKPSIELARERAKKEGLGNITFEMARSSDYPGNDFDLVTFFDCFHDMGDPLGAAKHVLESLKKKNDTWMIVEPFANDNLINNLNPIGRVLYSISSLVCVPASLNEQGPALGAQAGEKRISEIVKLAGFSKFRRATQTPFNLVFEAQP